MQLQAEYRTHPFPDVIVAPEGTPHNPLKPLFEVILPNIQLGLPDYLQDQQDGADLYVL